MENKQCVLEILLSEFCLPHSFSEINQKQKAHKVLHFKPHAAPHGAAHAQAIPQAKMQWMRAEGAIVCMVWAHEGTPGKVD